MLPVEPRRGSKGARQPVAVDPSAIRKEEPDLSNRVYEILFIVDPNLAETEVDALTAQVQSFVEKEGGVAQKLEKWVKKRLAYSVGRFREGYYVLIVAEAGASMVKEVTYTWSEEVGQAHM